MKPLLLLLLLSQATRSISVVETQALTRAAPSLATDGQTLSQARNLRVTLCAGTGETLSGAGALRAWYMTPGNTWSRTPELDLSVSTSGVRCHTWPDLEVGARAGRVLFAADGVTVSGGTTVTVRYEMGVQ